MISCGHLIILCLLGKKKKKRTAKAGPVCICGDHTAVGSGVEHTPLWPTSPRLPGASSIAHTLSPIAIRQLTVNEFTTLIEGFIFNSWINETPQDPPPHPKPSLRLLQPHMPVVQL